MGSSWDGIFIGYSGSFPGHNDNQGGYLGRSFERVVCLKINIVYIHQLEKE